MLRRSPRSSVLVAAVIFAGCGHREPPRPSVSPEPPRPAAAPVAAAPKGVAIVAQQIASGLRISYRLPRPTTTFAFYLPGRAIRNVSWRMLTPGLELVDDQVRGLHGATFEQFELLVTPDEAEHDRVYPSLFAMGPRAFVLNTQYLLGGDGPIDVELRAADQQAITSSFQPAAASVRFGLARADAEDKGHYVYFGDAVPTPPAGALSTFVVAPNVPAWLRTSLDEVMTKAVPLFGEQLGQPLNARPFVLVAYPDESGQRATYRGDTQANGEIALRFRGRGWSASTASNGDETRFLLHELVHLWNAELFRAPHGEHLAWLHEGSAEYLALAAARTLKLLAPNAVDERIADALNRCIGALGTRSLVDAAAPVRGGYYTCGVVVQWLAELSVAPKADAFAIRRATFAAAANRDRRYDVDAFLAEVKRLAPPERAPLMDFLFSTTTARDWTKLPALVAPHGVKLAPLAGAPWDLHRRGHALRHLLRESCTGPHGFFTFDDHVRLDSGDRCGVLSGDLAVVAIEGHDVSKAIDRAYRGLEARCRRAQPVRVRTKDGRTIAAPCGHALPAPAPMFRIE